MSRKLREVSYSKFKLGNSIFFISLIADVFANQAVEEIEVFHGFIESGFGCQQAVFYHFWFSNNYPFQKQVQYRSAAFFVPTY